MREKEYTQRILVTNIQRFSLHDGPGIRTTVFLKGCLMKCPWCCNPENISRQVQKYDKEGMIGSYGRYYTADELYNEVIKDVTYFGENEKDYNIAKADAIFRLPGGVTFSGGECLLQIEELSALCEKLKSQKVHMAVETSLYLPSENLKLALKYIDFFYVDIKILKAEGDGAGNYKNLDLYLSNLEILLKSHKPLVFRIPVIGGYTDDKENRRKVADLIFRSIPKGNVLKVELIKEHALGEEKYKSLGYRVPQYKGVSDRLLDAYRYELENRLQGSVPVEICRL
ncbi:MAG: radical SAM protein [Acetatifactor sp.]|nr:radical SAM protein [Acetatifactor sp.]